MITSDLEFDLAIEKTLRHEGGFVDHPSDPGGGTHHGIPLRFLRATGEMAAHDSDSDGDLDADAMRQLTRDQAVALYRKHFRDKHGYGRLPPGIDGKLFDLAVNMGSVRAHKLVQRACNDLRGPAHTTPKLAVDGALGPHSRAVTGQLPRDALYRALCWQAAEFYAGLVGKNQALAALAAFRENLAEFLKIIMR